MVERAEGNLLQSDVEALVNHGQHVGSWARALHCSSRRRSLRTLRRNERACRWRGSRLAACSCSSGWRGQGYHQHLPRRSTGCGHHSSLISARGCGSGERKCGNSGSARSPIPPSAANGGSCGVPPSTTVDQVGDSNGLHDVRVLVFDFSITQHCSSQRLPDRTFEAAHDSGRLAVIALMSPL